MDYIREKLKAIAADIARRVFTDDDIIKDIEYQILLLKELVIEAGDIARMPKVVGEPHLLDIHVSYNTIVKYLINKGWRDSGIRHAIMDPDEQYIHKKYRKGICIHRGNSYNRLVEIVEEIKRIENDQI